MRGATRAIALALTVIALTAGCGGGTDSSRPDSPDPTTAPTTTGAPEILRILVTNDDGVGAPGIAAVVRGLKALPDTEVTVVAPADNRSGSGQKRTEGRLTARDARTAAGDPATAVDGFPADAVTFALTGKAESDLPHLVVSGINEGQNLGVVIDASGTVGAARTAAGFGVPALAASQGLGARPDYPAGVRAVLAWVNDNRAELLAGPRGEASVTNLNIPTCPVGRPRAVVAVPPDPKRNGIAAVDCRTPFPSPRTDVEAFVHGYITRSDDLRPPLSP